VDERGEILRPEQEENLGLAPPDQSLEQETQPCQYENDCEGEYGRVIWRTLVAGQVEADCIAR
jgi:hypothetical protein